MPAVNMLCGGKKSLFLIWEDTCELPVENAKETW